MSPLAPVLQVLAEFTGLTAESLGQVTVEQAVAARMVAEQLRTPTEYAVRLRQNPVSMQQLLDDITVNETWFFRGGEVFTFLAAHIATETAGLGRPYRVLSIPCSSGEEPYSLAIALAERGIEPSRVAIEGFDLSLRAVEAGQRGFYRSLALRQLPEPMRGRYFIERHGWFELSPAIRAAVSLRQGNLLDPQLLATAERFDLVFCRNLLIYLDEPARQLAGHRLQRLVTAGGLVILGHADQPRVLGDAFARSGPAGGFVYRHTVPAVAREIHPAASAREVLPAASAHRQPLAVRPPSAVRPPVRRSPPQPRAVVAPPAPQPPLPVASIDLLRGLADRGDTDAAVAGLRDLLAGPQPSAEAYCLLGVLERSRHNEEEASDAFRRALYLDPRHSEALHHLMLLKRAAGRFGEAEQLERRLAAVRPQEPA